MSATLRKGRRSTAERINAALEVMHGTQPIDALAEKYGVHVSTLEAWQITAMRGMQMAFDGTTPPVATAPARSIPTEAYIGATEKENKRLADKLAAYKVKLRKSADDCRHVALVIENLLADRE